MSLSISRTSKKTNNTFLDNDISLMYKSALQQYGIPTFYLYYEYINDNIIYKSIFDLVKKYINDNINLYHIYLNLVEIKDNLNIKDDLDDELPYIYYKSRLDIKKNTGIKLKIKIINEIIDYYNKLNITTINTDYVSWESSYKQWEITYKSLYKKDKDVLSYITDVQNNLLKYEPLPISPIIYRNITINAKVKFPDNTIPSVSSGIDIFDNSTLSEDIPYIKYIGSYENEDVKIYHKIYESSLLKSIQYYNIIVPQLGKMDNVNTIYLTVQNQKNFQNKLKKDNYSRISYNLDNNTISTNIPINDGDNDNFIISRFEEHLKLNLYDINISNISGFFYIYNISFNYVLLLDAILNLDLFNAYLYINESTTPISEKKRINIKFKSILSTITTKTSLKPENKESFPYSINFTLSQEYITDSKDVETYNPISNETNTIKLDNNTPYIKVNILSARSYKEIKLFSSIITRLFSFYTKIQKKLKKFYEKYFPDIEYSYRKKTSNLPSPSSAAPSPFSIYSPSYKKVESIPSKGPGRRGTEGSFIKNLSEYAPDLFISGYARKCSGSATNMRQPVIIEEKKRKEWGFSDIMPFKYNNKNIYFGCPNEDFPYPGLQINDLTNKNIYPCLPCCFKTPQMNKPKYKICLSGNTSTSSIKSPTSTSTSYIIKGTQILPPNRFGLLPKTLTDILSFSGSRKNSNLIISRLGFPKSPNSFIHCILFAMDYYKYIHSKNTERLVTKYRKELLDNNKFNIDLVKQEMYDIPDSVIIDNLKNSSFFDSRFYYRIFEKLFDINIFVFSIDDSSNPFLELPRHKLFHIRYLNPNNNSVILFRNEGSSKDNLEYSQYELIIDLDTLTKKYVKIFNSPFFYDILYNTYSLYTWNIDIDINNNPIIYNNINPYSTNNSILDKIFKNKNYTDISQIIDNFGKMRAINYKNTNNLSVIISSGQPYDLKSGLLNYSSSIEYILKNYGNPISIEVSNDQKFIIGLWFDVKNTDYILIPVSKISISDDTHNLSSLPIGHPNPFPPKSTDRIFRLSKLRRILNIYLQIILWAYIISRLSVNNFVKKYMYINDSSIYSDSLSVYDFSNIPRIYPSNIYTIDEVITYLSLKSPSIIKDNKFYLYSKKFADGVIFFLTDFYKNNEGLEISIPDSISNYYVNYNDFKHQENVLLFINDEYFNIWFSSVSQTCFDYNMIKSTIDISFASLLDPYFYMDTDNKIYIIQNVLDGNLTSALNISNVWNTKKLNIGFFSNPIDSIIPYILYEISISNNLILSDIQPYPDILESSNLLNIPLILNYGNDYYASILLLYYPKSSENILSISPISSSKPLKKSTKLLKKSIKKVKSSVKEVESSFKSPVKKVESSFKSPVKKVESSVKSPVKKVESSVKSPVKKVESSVKKSISNSPNKYYL